TLEALRAAKAAGSTVLGLVNVVGSTIARTADGGVYLHAGPEIGVASTKAFTAQVVALLLLGLYLGRQRGLPAEQGRALVAQLVRLPELVERALAVEPQVKALAERYADAPNALYLGRGVNFPVALQDPVYAKVVSNMQEVKARGGRLIAITSEGNGDLSQLVDHQIAVPASPPLITPVLTVIPLQLLAYHIAVLRGCDVDRPRN